MGWGVLARALAAALLAGLLVMLGGVIYALTQPTTHTATSVFTVQARSPETLSADSVRLRASSYVAFVSAPTQVEQVARVNGLDPDKIAANTEVSLDPGSANVRIAVILPTAAGATIAANGLADAGVLRAAEDPLVTAELVSRALPEAAQTNPPRTQIIIGAAVAAVIVTVLTLSALTRRRSRTDPQ